MRLRAGVLIALLVVGCAGQRPKDTPPTGLEAGFALREVSPGGTRRGLTHPGGDLAGVLRSADGRKVDLDSTIEIVPLPERIRAGLPDTTSVVGLDDATKDMTLLADVVQDLADYVVARDIAMRAYKTAQAARTERVEQDFFTKRSDAAELERAVIAKLRALPGSLVKPADIQGAAADFALVGDLISARLAELEKESGRLTDAATFQLRMEAFLRSPGKEPAAVHLPSYDSLDEGNLVRRDRRGLLLQGDEKTRFEELAKQSQRLAELGNRYLAGQADLAEVFKGVAGTVLEDFGKLGTDLEELIEEFESGDARGHLTALEASAKAVADAIAQALEDAADDALEELEDEADALKADLEGSGTGKLRVLAERVKALRGMIESPDPASLAAAIDLIHAMATDRQGWDDAIDGIGEHLQGMIDIVEDLGDDLDPTVRAVYEQNKASLDAELEYFEGLAKRVKDSLEALKTLLDLDRDVTPLRTDLRVPEAIDVELDAAPATRLRLRRTQRLDGDTLSLRMTVLDGEETIGDPLLIDLDVATIGWHARLHPSVVLAEPERAVGTGTLNRRFAPSVSWLWSYTPPDDADEWYDELARRTGLGFGPHATFVSFDPNKEVEIGLGMTVSFWDGVLQIGAGYDLMADRTTSYTFFGSSLIAVLQRFEDR